MATGSGWDSMPDPRAITLSGVCLQTLHTHSFWDTPEDAMSNTTFLVFRIWFDGNEPIPLDDALRAARLIAAHVETTVTLVDEAELGGEG